MGQTITMVYDWETQQVQHQFMAVGTKFLNRLVSDWQEKSVKNSQSAQWIGNTICDIVWPDLKPTLEGWFASNMTQDEVFDHFIKDVKMVLLPLDRLGQEQGKSGAHSVLCYFRYESFTEIQSSGEPADEARRMLSLNSLPIIIKHAEEPIAPMGESPTHIQTEFENANTVSPYLRHSNTFVLPFYYHREQSGEGSQREFLLSNSIVDYGGKQISFSNSSIHTFLNVLQTSEKHSAVSANTKIKSADILSFVYRKLRNLHCGPYSTGRVQTHIESRSYAEEYNKYLRKMDTPAARAAFQQLWCTNDDIESCSEKCPLKVLDLVLSITTQLHMGGIHGDFHPRNIVMLGDLTAALPEAHIIDYGWANKYSHIAKDYVLMECNLRFMCLNPDLPKRDVEKISRLISTNELNDAVAEISKDGSCSYADDILLLIMEVRSNFQQTLQEIDSSLKNVPLSDDLWLYEYHIPMFLVAYGLTKFYGECRNQVAMRLTISKLTSFLWDKIKKQTTDENIQV